MKLHFIGAAEEVTGSCHLIDLDDKKVVMDCGLYQGKRLEAFKKNREMLFNPEEISSVVLSHAHLDHSGNVPTLVRKGFKGNIYSTFATRDLCRVMLEDSAYIQSLDEEYFEKLKKKGIADPLEEIGPLYDVEDVDKAIHAFMALDYHRTFYINKYMEGMFFDAGHILGSSLCYFNIEKDGKKVRLGFTGDLGRNDLPILRDPERFPELDYLIIESTYGNREHDDIKSVHDHLKKVINKTVERGGKIIIPAFALERTQELIYHLHLLWHDKAIPDLPIYVDSPLAIRVTDIFKMHPECYDKETQEEFARNHNPFGFENMKYVTSVEESKSLNQMQTPCIIISASGMCEAGRIRHHLANNIEDRRNTILVVGYMAQNTLGRRIVEKEEKVKIFDHFYNLRAEVCVMNAFSAHADKHGLFQFVKETPGLKKVFIVHGEPDQQKPFAEKIRNDLNIEAVIPKRDEVIEL